MKRRLLTARLCFRESRYVDLPAIMPTAVIMLILEIGRILNMGYEKILAMQNQNNLCVGSYPDLCV